MNRLPAFHEENFLGSDDQLRALVAVSGILPLLVTQKSRPLPKDDDIVSWPGGACYYGDAAKFTPSRLEGLKTAGYAICAKMFYEVPEGGIDAETSARFGELLRHMDAQDWLLPREDAKVADCFWHHPIKDPVRDLRKRLFADDVIGRFFACDAEGYLEPSSAAAGLEDVFVVTGGKRYAWGQIGHVGQKRLSEFTALMGDSILGCITQSRLAADRSDQLAGLYRRRLPRSDRFR